MLYDVLVGVCVAFVFSLPMLIKAIVKEIREKIAMNKMIIETPDGQTDVFNYKGKAYSRQMYIDYRVDQYETFSYRKGRRLSDKELAELIKIANIRVNKPHKAEMGAADLAAIEEYQKRNQ